ncbi:protein CHROMATIN REMODELING 24-like [Mercurialis annua]|uniref:protein CHROMATIN REMODELING 24-like n=1 Tax=Mercurialis annua TaxID=3986 RepID=UPI0024AD97B3|nr:protein CHROMATIN REMODELING 24-like [Mercurialis annua]
MVKEVLLKKPWGSSLVLQESLESHGYKFLRIDGTTKANDRVKIVDVKIFKKIICVCSIDNQNVDRAHRIGQRKDVIVYRLITCGTVEEKIYRKQIYKGGLFKIATEDKEQIRYFSRRDLEELFNPPKQGFDISLTQQQLNKEHNHQLKMTSIYNIFMFYLSLLIIL